MPTDPGIALWTGFYLENEATSARFFLGDALSKNSGSAHFAIPTNDGGVQLTTGSYKVRGYIYDSSGEKAFTYSNVFQITASNLLTVNYDACRLDKLDGSNITRDAITDQSQCLAKICDVYGPGNLPQTESKCIFNGQEIKRYTKRVTYPTVPVNLSVFGVNARNAIGGSDTKPIFNITSGQPLWDVLFANEAGYFTDTYFDMTYTLYDNATNKILKSETLSSIVAGYYLANPYPFSMLYDYVPGEYRYSITINPQHTIPESDYTNNTFTGYFTIVNSI